MVGTRDFKGLVMIGHLVKKAEAMKRFESRVNFEWFCDAQEERLRKQLADDREPELADRYVTMRRTYDLEVRGQLTGNQDRRRAGVE